MCGGGGCPPPFLGLSFNIDTRNVVVIFTNLFGTAQLYVTCIFMGVIKNTNLFLFPL